MTLVPDLIAMVERFNRQIIGLPVPDQPTRLDPERKKWAVGALSEELVEFMYAETLEDEVDALLDLTYFALGRVIEMGVLPGAAFEEIHEANMRKERGELSKRPHAKGHDAIKPEGWTPPDLMPYLTIRKGDLEVLHFLDKMASKNPTARLRAARGAMQKRPDFVGLDFKGIEQRVMSMGFKPPYTEPKRLKVLVIGHARHGKDTVGEMLERLYGLKFTSSSRFCAEHVIMPKVKEHWRQYATDPLHAPAFPNYKTVEECFEDRVNHRAFWYETIRAFNSSDPTALGRAIFKENDVYCGVRHPAELNAMVNAGIPDVVVWVDRSEHLPPEDRSSCKVEPWMADFVIDNNGSLEDLERNVRSLFDRLLEDE